MGRGDGAPQGGEADGAPAAFRERELADSGRKNLEKKTGDLGSEEEARRRGKWRPKAARISEAHLGRRKAVSRDDSVTVLAAEWRSGGDAGVRDDAVKPSVAVARSGVGLLEGVDGRRSSGPRCGGVSEAERVKGVGAGVRHGTAMPMVVAAQRGGVRLEAWRRAAELGLAWEVREKARRARESWGNERGECGKEFYGCGTAGGGRGDADSGQQPPAAWGGDVGTWRGKPAQFSWGKIGEMVEEVGGCSSTTWA
ncbi:hypothetical protein [Oryza sativa Japonica Group]|uniref:Uncharacterized protein OJ1126_G08.3 n=1 Tax=Oryza sativa subsp. japonica TaxID=39947 RepID=Q5VNH6_ORYSJ|nr:hypothetical protein [Oryza sativa Japonica Group]